MTRICLECGLFTKADAGGLKINQSKFYFDKSVIFILFSLVYARIYTRMQNPSCETLDEAKKVLIKCGVNLNDTTEEDQQNCRYC